MTIEEFIKARIAEREDAARATVEIGQKYTLEGYSHEYEWARILINPNGKRQGSYTFEPGAPSPEEVLRQCAALRRVVDAEIANLEFRDCELGDGCTDADIRAGRCRDRGDIERSAVLRALAAVWSDHPDYQQDWAI